MMQKTTALLWSSAALLCGQALAGLQIFNPSSLKAEFGEDAIVNSKLSNIGWSNYQKGTSRIGQVITPFREDGQGCEPFDWDKDFTVEEMMNFDKSEGFFLLLQRGGCPFSTKVKYAQQFGAEVVIVSDFREAGDEQIAQSSYEGKLDGTLQTHVPVFEIDWESARKMVDYIHLGQEVVYIKVTFDVTKEDNTVEVDLWYSTSLDLGLNLSTELAAMSLSFTADHASKPLFTPRIATYSCINCDDKFKADNCLSNGVYCGYTPNFYKEYDLQNKGVSMTGKEILTQALREKCLHELMSTKYQEEGDLFWTFFGYLGKCFALGDPLTDLEDMPKNFNECYDWSTVMIEGTEEIDTLRACVDGSFAVPGDVETDNSILRDDRIWANANQMRLHPSVTINNITHTNSTGQDLALAICEAYREAPDECELSWQLATFEVQEKYDGLVTPHQDDGLFAQSKTHEAQSEAEAIFGQWHLYAIVGTILVINFAVMFVLRWRMKRTMRTQLNSSVNEAVSQYFALSGQDSAAQ